MVEKKSAKKASLDQAMPIADPKENIEEKLIKSQRNKELYKALKRLRPIIYREVVILRFINELSAKEAGKILGKSAVLIRVIQHRALKKLRKIMKWMNNN